jgi:hypothetical protein
MMTTKAWWTRFCSFLVVGGACAAIQGAARADTTYCGGSRQPTPMRIRALNNEGYVYVGPAAKCGGDEHIMLYGRVRLGVMRDEYDVNSLGPSYLRASVDAYTLDTGCRQVFWTRMGYHLIVYQWTDGVGWKSCYDSSWRIWDDTYGAFGAAANGGCPPDYNGDMTACTPGHYFCLKEVVGGRDADGTWRQGSISTHCNDPVADGLWWGGDE